MALLEAINDFLGIFEVIIVIMIVIEFFRLFKGGMGDGRLGGLGGSRVPNLFGRAAGNEEAESRRSQAQEGAEEGEEKKGAADLAQAEKLLDADIKEAEQLKNFFGEIERVPLTPEYARRIAKERGGALRNAVKKLLNYSRQADAAVDAAYKQNYAALNTLGRELKERAVIDARAERDKLPRDQKDARAKAYDTTLRSEQARIQTYLKDIRNRGVQAAHEEKKIELVINQIEVAENAVVEEVNKLVDALSQGDTNGSTAAATLAIRSLQAAEAGLREAKQFVAAVRKQLAGIIGELYNTRKELNRERVEEHFEQANAQKI